MPISKSKGDTLTGIASTLSLDRDEEKMSENAMRDMEREIVINGVNLFEDHNHGWQNTLGVIKRAHIDNNELNVEINLDNPSTNPKVVSLLEKLKKGIKLGLSVGGAVTKEYESYDKNLGKKVKVIDGVKLFEISVVGIPSNADSFLSLNSAIIKCLKEPHKCPLCFNVYKGSKCDICWYSSF